ERAAKWARRRPVPALLLTLGIAVFLAMIGGGFVHERHLRFEQARRIVWERGQENEGSQLIDQAREARTREALARYQLDLSKFGERLGGQSGLQLLRSRIEGSLRLVKGRIEELDAQAAVRARERDDSERFERFQDLLVQSLVHDTQFKGLDLGGDQ